MAAAVSDETWAEIEQLYRTTEESEVAIARRFGLHHFAVYQRARSRRWQRPAAPAGVATAPNDADGAATAPAPPRRAPKSTSVSRRRPARKRPASAQQARDDLILRLYGALATKLTQLEDRMAEGTPPMSPEESERHTREIASMIQGFEKITEVASDAAKTDAAQRPLQPVVTTLADIARVRRELAERLHRAWGRPAG